MAIRSDSTNQHGLDSSRRQIRDTEGFMKFWNRFKSAVYDYFGGNYYTGAGTKHSLRGWFPNEYDPEAETLDNQTLRRRTRDLFRNNTVGSGAIRTLTTNVIGMGLKLQPRIDRKFLQISDEQIHLCQGSRHGSTE